MAIDSHDNISGTFFFHLYKIKDYRKQRERGRKNNSKKHYFIKENYAKK